MSENEEFTKTSDENISEPIDNTVCETTEPSENVCEAAASSETVTGINNSDSRFATVEPLTESDDRYDKYINYTENTVSEAADTDNPAPAQGSAYAGNPYGNPAPAQGKTYGNSPYGNPAPAQGWSYGSGAPIPGSVYTYHSNAPIPGTAEYNPYAYGNPYAPIQPPQKKRVKKPCPKWLATILLALLFGAVAAGVFLLTTNLYYKINPSAAPILSESSEQTGAQGNSSSANVVASTDIITNVDTTVTDVSATVEAVMPSIVSIECTFNTQSFFGMYETSGAGSGIILRKTDSELMIATNNHVVSNATSIKVCFCDGTYVSAVIKGTDSVADLAVISIMLNDIGEDTLKAIRVASLGNSDDIKVGQMAIAIGNAMGYGQSTTVGYISAKDREVTVDGNVMTLLQTDAAINPGNSGGALLNIRGEVIGINSVKYADSDVEGMGFAIPISRATDILDELSNREILSDAEKGYLGIYLQEVTATIAEAYHWPMGVYVADLIEGCAAEKAGILAGDIITAINGTKVLTSTDLKNCITSHRVGTTVQITLQRLIDGKFEEQTINVTLGSNPDYVPAETDH